MTRNPTVPIQPPRPATPAVVARGFEGVILAANLHDLVQMQCLTAHTRMVRIVSGEEEGRLYFANGQVVHAEVGELSGQTAFFELMTWSNGAFHIDEGVRPMRETINRSWESLLMEAAHELDERQHNVAQFSSPEHPAPCPVKDVFEHPDVVCAIRYGTDDTVLESKGADPLTLQGAVAYVSQILAHIGTDVGVEKLREMQLIGPDRRLLVIMKDDSTTALVASSDADMETFAAKLRRF